MRDILKLAIVLLIVAGLSICRASNADDGILRQDESDAAHFAVSYILTNTTYMLLHQGVGMDKTSARIFSAFIVGTGTALKEIHDFQPSTRDMKLNLLGIGCAIGTTFVFNF